MLANLYWFDVRNNYVNAETKVKLRASKSPDLAGDLPIFDIVMTISRSPELEWKSPDLLQETRLALSTANLAIVVQAKRLSVWQMWLKTFCQFGGRNFYSV